MRPSEVYANPEPYKDWPVSRFLCEATQLDCPAWVWEKVKELEHSNFNNERLLEQIKSEGEERQLFINEMGWEVEAWGQYTNGFLIGKLRDAIKEGE